MESLEIEIVTLKFEVFVLAKHEAYTSHMYVVYNIIIKKQESPPA